MKLKSPAFSLYVWCLFITTLTEIHQISSENTQPPLEPYEDGEMESGMSGSAPKVPNRNEKEPEYQISSTTESQRMPTPTKSDINDMVTSDKLETDSNFFAIAGSGEIPTSDDLNKTGEVSTVAESVSTTPYSRISAINSDNANTKAGSSTPSGSPETTNTKRTESKIPSLETGTVTTADASVAITTKLTDAPNDYLPSHHSLSNSELLLLIGVLFASFLLILSSFIILAVTLVAVVRNKSKMLINMITVHNYGACSDHESDIEYIEEQPQQILTVQETANEEISVNTITNDNHESTLEQNFVRADENKVVKLDLKETTKDDSVIANETERELITVIVTGSEPRIVNFESLVKAKEGEQVTLRVNFTGIPKPTITWTFKGTKMEGDYATELGTDGSLVFFCVEPKHTGKYDFEIKNDFGNIQGFMTLDVEEDIPAQQHTEATDVIEKTNNLESNPIVQEMFRQHVAGLHLLNNKAFEIQYKSLLSGEEGKQVSVGRSDKFKALNRFRNITAYDDCRIVLEPIIGNADFQYDYINASYVDGLSQAKMFIATQGPLPHTVIDFWRLVWQEKVKSIAMVTNLKEGMKVKCEQYWPEQGQEKQLGPYTVTTVEQQCFPYYNIRKILLKYTAGIVGIAVSREIIQYHFTSWPDHGVPECPGPILNYLKRIKSKHKSDDGPILVHCSAGVGRTGTLIAIDIALSQASKEKQVDIPKIIVDMRRQRMKMVQTVNQYVFIHDAVLEALVCGDTRIPASDLRQVVERLKQKDEHNKGKTGLEQQFEILETVSPKPLEIARSSALKHSDKNRNNNFLPPDRWRVRLKGRSPDQDYIHASYAHGYKQRKGIIIAQSPMLSTVGDFVKMLYERECGVVVMLCGCEEGGVEMCAQYWPTTTDTTTKHKELLVSTVKVTERDGITQRLITITDSRYDKVEPHKVTQFQLDQWNAEDLCSNTQALIDVINQIRELVLQRNMENKPVTVHGSDTVSRVGVFCSLMNAIEMCKTEGVVDVFQVVKALRIQKPGAVLTANQYSFIFDVVLTVSNT